MILRITYGNTPLIAIETIAMKDIGKEGKKIGVTFSAFDLCHAGHMMMLRDAKAQCDYLIVGLQDDPSQGTDEAYRLSTGGKPKNAPIMSLFERKTILESIKYVDEIFVYSTEKDLYDWLTHNHYDVRILGSDWKGKPYTGHDLPHKAHFHQRTHSYSTSELRMRVYRAEKEKIEEKEREVVHELENVRGKTAPSYGTSPA